MINISLGWVAVIAPWFCLRLLSCGPGFESHIFTFFNLYYWNCIEKIMKIIKKRPGLAHFFKKKLLDRFGQYGTHSTIYNRAPCLKRCMCPPLGLDRKYVFGVVDQCLSISEPNHRVHFTKQGYFSFYRSPRIEHRKYFSYQGYIDIKVEASN